MSWRVLQATRARMLDSGIPAWELICGWDPATRSYFATIQDQMNQCVLWQAGERGEMPEWSDLVEVFRDLAEGGYIYWPLDPDFAAVLQADKVRNLSTNDQDWHEVERRKADRLASVS